MASLGRTSGDGANLFLIAQVYVPNSVCVFRYSSDIQERMNNVVVVCNKQASSGPVDKEGLRYRAANARYQPSGGAATAGGVMGPPKTLEEVENRMDGRAVRKGVVRCNPDLQYKTKGPQPSDKEQMLWAPLTYFVYSVAGNVVVLMNKMGMFKLSINYGVKTVCDYLCKYVNSSLQCFVSPEDQTNSSRYVACSSGMLSAISSWNF